MPNSFFHWLYSETWPSKELLESRGVIIKLQNNIKGQLQVLSTSNITALCTLSKSTFAATFSMDHWIGVKLLQSSCPAAFFLYSFSPTENMVLAFQTGQLFSEGEQYSGKSLFLSPYWLNWLLNFISKEKKNDQGIGWQTSGFWNPWSSSLFPNLFAYLNEICISCR